MAKSNHTTVDSDQMPIDAETLVTVWAAYCWLQGWRHCGVAVTIPEPMRGMAYAYLVLDRDVPEPMRSRCHTSPHLPTGTVAFDPCEDASGRAPDASLYGAERTAYAWLPDGAPEPTTTEDP